MVNPLAMIRKDEPRAHDLPTVKCNLMSNTVEEDNMMSMRFIRDYGGPECQMRRLSNQNKKHEGYGATQDSNS